MGDSKNQGPQGRSPYNKDHRILEAILLPKDRSPYNEDHSILELVRGHRIPTPPNVPLLRALWSLLDGIWGLLRGGWGVLVLELVLVPRLYGNSHIPSRLQTRFFG